jgi:hypothetical protein
MIIALVLLSLMRNALFNVDFFKSGDQRLDNARITDFAQCINGSLGHTATLVILQGLDQILALFRTFIYYMLGLKIDIVVSSEVFVADYDRVVSGEFLNST